MLTTVLRIGWIKSVLNIEREWDTQRELTQTCVTPFTLCYAMCVRVRVSHSQHTLWTRGWIQMFGSISVSVLLRKYFAVLSRARTRAHIWTTIERTNEKMKWVREIWMPEKTTTIKYILFSAFFSLVFFFFGYVLKCVRLCIHNTVDESVVHAIWYNNISMVCLFYTHSTRLWTIVYAVQKE